MGALFMVADEPSLAEAIAGAQFDLVIADLSFPVSSRGERCQAAQEIEPRTQGHHPEHP